ncbi:MAG TPA: type VII secretion integral membrane protein EccD [Mycobacterium sp.]|nr:type VII secretion integral membrane protein EccD [Mycobacterium sp.]
MTVENLYRIAVHPDRWGDTSATDLVVPAQIELGELMPGILELVGRQPSRDSGELGQQWTLSRLDGATLDESLSLFENGVHDGDLLLLTTEARVTAPTFSDISHYVVDAAARTTHGGVWSRRLGACSWLWSTGSGAAALVWPAHAGNGSRAVAAAIVAVAASVSAVVASRAGLEMSSTLSIGMAAVAFGAVAGYLMVPGGPAPPNFLLAAAICSAMATVLLHVTGGGASLWMAITACSSLLAVAAAVATLWAVPTAAVGSFLAAASLAMLSGAAKLSIAIARLSPRMPTTEEATDDRTTVPAAVGFEKAALGHDVLTGLLTGFSLAAALGTTIVVLGTHRESLWPRAVLALAIGAALAFRACQQRDVLRLATLLVSALVCATALSASVLSSAPGQAIWVCLATIALGAAAMCLPRMDLGDRLSPPMRRGLDAVDYVALAAVVPVACWTAGVFDLVRGASLS